MGKESITAEKSFIFAVEIVQLCKILKCRNEWIFADQLLRCGTSIGSNVHEAGAAQSRRDFISKMAIASKEARETRYWLQLINATNVLEVDLTPYLYDINELIRLLTASVKTATNRN